ncbi:MAG TPA: mismatch repair protein, partial [Acidobacteriaceae bacterium]|nr:mismatch repair protein [Acidobacteriaceae bacterium]
MPSRCSTSLQLPRDEYSQRLDQARQRQKEFERRERLIGYVQLAVSAAAILWALWLVRHWSRSGYLLAIPAAVFLVLAGLHEALIRAVRRSSRVVLFYERAMQRVEDRWAGTGESGERFLDPSHPYAKDLDLFGEASLFELLCTARTRAGEETLARWLLAPAAVEEIRGRQTAALELKHRLDLREKVFTLGESFRAGVRPQALSAWGEHRPLFEARLLRMAAPALAAVWIASFAAWGVRGNVTFVAAATLANFLLSHRYRMRVNERASAVEEAGSDLALLAKVFAAFEQESFASASLVELQARLRREGVSSSSAIAALSRRLDLLESGHNLVVKMLDPVLFWNLQCVLAIEVWRRRFGESIRGWIEAVGELEALLALAAYLYEHPDDVFPEFVEERPFFHAEGLAHPLIPVARAVRNDLELGVDLRLILVSGPNMAGKSTFLRGIGVNAVLAQCGAPVRADRMRLSRVEVAASICVLDSLQGGVSRFYNEIHRLKRIMDLTSGDLPVLFLLDELLSGTNSHDRLLGTRSLVEKLIERGAIGLVTTHDLALTEIPQTLGASAANCHFADQLKDGALSFDYKLRPGVVQSS